MKNLLVTGLIIAIIAVLGGSGIMAVIHIAMICIGIMFAAFIGVILCWFFAAVVHALVF